MPQTFDIVFLGTGSPLPSMDRCGAGQVVTQCLRDIKRYLELGRQVTLRANAISQTGA